MLPLECILYYPQWHPTVFPNPMSHMASHPGIHLASHAAIFCRANLTKWRPINNVNAHPFVQFLHEPLIPPHIPNGIPPMSQMASHPTPCPTWHPKPCPPMTANLTSNDIPHYAPIPCPTWHSTLSNIDNCMAQGQTMSLWLLFIYCRWECSSRTHYVFMTIGHLR